MSTVGSAKNASNRSRRFKFVESVLTDVGRRRSENQDAYGIAHTDEISLFIVADGMGGARGGGTASSLAVNVVSRYAFSEVGKLTAASLKNSIECSNSVIFNKSQSDEELSGMGTTIVALAFVGEQCVVAHVGDSRIYRLRGDSLEQLTRDHTLVQELVDTGAIPPEEAADHPIAHMLTRSLGPTDAIEVEIRVLPDLCEEGDQFLLCSDGLYNLVTDEEIQEKMSSLEPEPAAKELVDLALERGGTDNVTVEIVRLVDIADNDESVSADYPTDASVSLNLSEPTEIPNLDEMIIAVVGEKTKPEAIPVDESVESTPVAEGGEEQGAAEESLDDDSLAEADSSDELDSVALEGEELEKLTAQAGGKEFRFFQFAGAFLGLAALGAVAYVFLTLESPDAVQVASLDSSNPDTQRDELSEELAQWADDKNSASPEALPPEGSELAVAIEEKLEVSDGEESPSEESEAGEDDTGEGQEPEAAVAPTAEDIKKIIGVDGESTVVDEKAQSAEGSSESVEETVISAAEIESKIEELASLEVPEPPVIDLRDDSLDKIPANQPIVWENEALKVARVRDEQARPEDVVEGATVDTPLIETASAKSSGSKILAAVELSEVVDRKVQVRERIADLDVKLRLLSFNSPSEIRLQASALRAEKVKAETLLSETNKKLSDAKDGVKKWLAFQQKASALAEPKELADEVAELSEELFAKREKYTQASRDYLQAVDLWQAEPDNLTAASKMGALGRLLQQRRREFEDGVVIAIAHGVESSIEAVSTLSVARSRLENRVQQLSRHLGYYEGFTPLAAERKRDLRSSYFSDRKSLVGELEELRATVSDEKEKQIKQEQAAPQTSQASLS